MHVAAAGSDAYRLSDLQAYLTRWPAEHYSSQGREPLLYAVVLLLTLQPRTAVAFLARHASCASFRVDSVHLAMALVHHKVCTASVGYSVCLRWLSVSQAVDTYPVRQLVQSAEDVLASCTTQR